MLDTRHFDSDFKNRLLANFDDLDNETDGLLIHGENFQGLNLLTEKYRESVKTIYIDPPYNTKGSDFLYKDQYKHASWLSLIADRISLTHEILSSEGAIFISIDDNEQHHLRKLMDEIFGERNFRNIISVRRGVKSVQAQFEYVDRLNVGSEYIIFFSKSLDMKFPHLTVDLNEHKVGSWNNHWRGTDRPTMRYDLLGITPETGQWRWKEERSLTAIENYRCLLDECGVNPTQTEIDNWWYAQSPGKPDLLRMSTTNRPEHYVPPSDRRILSSLWTDLIVNESSSLTNALSIEFSNPKRTQLIKRIINYATVGDENSFILDFFAGSGTTAHATINLNRQDNGKRKYILIEMGHHFDTTLIPRIKKAIYAEKWKNAKPVSRDSRLSHIIKYQRIESYEDTLNNIKFKAHENTLFKEHQLNYLLGSETRESQTLLNATQLQSPFNYQLNIVKDMQVHAQPVDLPETFNYLIGIHVQTRRTLHDDNRRYLIYRGTIKQKTIVIIWRETRNWTQQHYERDYQFIQHHNLTQGADKTYINTDSIVPEAEALDPLFKRLMFTET